METSSENESNRALLKKYLNGECTGEERQVIEEWYNSFDESDLPGREQEKFSLNKVKKLLLKAVREDLKPKKAVLRLPLYTRVAAMLFIISSITLLIYQAGGFTGESQQEFHASNGQIQVVTLQDGSIVTLNSGSTLKISSDFQKKERSVELSGEAYFQVTKDASKPFIVSSGSVSTRVLGTAFNVQAYKNDRLLAVTVSEGKVRVNSMQTRLSQDLTPGKQLIYDKDHQTAKVGAANAEHVSAWRSGILYFDNESIPDIIKRLERKFNVTINTTGEVRPDCRYTLRINDDTLEQTLRLLTKVAGISYQTNQQDQITINTYICK